jgi:hypothetical protein
MMQVGATNTSIEYHRELELRQDATAMDVTRVNPMAGYGDILRLQNTPEARFARIALDARVSTLTTSREDIALLKRVIPALAILEQLSPEDI